MRCLVPIAALALAACGAKSSDRPDGAQDPITFRIVNPFGSVAGYMDWTHEGRTEIVGRGHTDTSRRFFWFHPPCTMDCEEVPEGECACLECEPDEPVMREFEPFGEVLVEWEGPDVYTLEEDECGCFCARARPLMSPDAIDVGLVSHEGYSCAGDCAPDAGGLIAGALPDGNRRCGTLYLELPYERDDLTLLMGTVCEGDWP